MLDATVSDPESIALVEQFTPVTPIANDSSYAAIAPNVLAPTRLPLRMLHVSPDNPRTHVVQDEAFEEFKSNVAALGVHTALIVRPVQGKKTPYEIVAGQRRFLAAFLAFGQDYEILVSCSVMSDEEAERIAASENIERAAMSEAEEARAAAKMLARCNGDRPETAKRMGWSVSNLSNRLKLMACSKAVLDKRIKEPGILSLGLAEMLSGLPHDKQDEMLANFVKSGFPTVETAKVLIMAMTKSLPGAIFDKAECGSCPHNSARQQAMFGNIDEGHCLNSSCYDQKTEAQLQINVQNLQDDFQRVEVVRPGDKYRVIKLKAEEVGPEQAVACENCKDFGAAVSGLPNKLGAVMRGICFNSECNSEKVASYKSALAAQAAAQKALESSQDVAQAPAAESTPDASKAKGTSATPAPAKKPVATVKTQEAAPVVELSNAVHEFRDNLYRRVVLMEFGKNPEYASRFVLALILSHQSSKIKGDKLGAQLVKLGVLSKEPSAFDVAKAMKALMNMDNAMATNALPYLGTTAIEAIEREQLRSLVVLSQADLSKYFVLNDASGKALLEKITKNQIIAICNEVGISAAMGKTFQSLANGKKDEFIKQVTSVKDFEYAGKVPRVLKPDFAK